MRFRGKGSAASCRAGAYPDGPVAAPEGALWSLRYARSRPGGMWMRAAPPSGPALSIAAEAWGPVQAAAARRSYFQIFQTFQILFDFRQPGVGLGDQPRVPGYLPWPVPLAEGFLVRLRAVQRTQAGPVIFRSGVRKSSSSCTNPSSAGAMRSSRFLVCAAGEDRPFAAAPGAGDRLLGEAGTRAFFVPQAGFSRRVLRGPWFCLVPLCVTDPPSSHASSGSSLSSRAASCAMSLSPSSCPFCESVVVLAATLLLGLAVELTAVGPLGEGLSKAALAMLAV